MPSSRENAQTVTCDMADRRRSVRSFATRKKYRDALRHPKAAFVVDDIVSVNPWRVRSIEVRGAVQVLESGGTALGPGFSLEMFRITPKRIVSWGLGEHMAFEARSVS
jgi:pyridoxamine 5'-phosphate oxidase family protein